jgi:integrase
VLQRWSKRQNLRKRCVDAELGQPTALDSRCLSDYGTHTLRRTTATLIYRRTKNLRAVQLLLGHIKLESTVRYLGIEVNDALEMAEQVQRRLAGQRLGR